MAALATLPTGGKNGTPVLAFSEELYTRFKEALLGARPPLISDVPDPRNFVEKHRASLEKNPRPRIGNWLKSLRKINFPAIHQGDWGKNEDGYETTLKCIPPINEDVLMQCLRRFENEFGLQSQRDFSFSEHDRNQFTREGNTSAATQHYSHHPMTYGPAGSDDLVKIQITDLEFEKIRTQIHIPTPVNERKP